jgi:hypothetical protein
MKIFIKLKTKLIFLNLLLLIQSFVPSYAQSQSQINQSLSTISTKNQSNVPELTQKQNPQDTIIQDSIPKQDTTSLQTPIKEPYWKTATLLNIKVDNKTLTKKEKNDRNDYIEKKFKTIKNAPDSITTIKGEDLLYFINNIFDPNKNFPQEQLNQALALTILSKNLDYYADWLKLEKSPSEERAFYVLHALTIKNAVNKNKVKTKIVIIDGKKKKFADENVMLIPIEKRYEWLVETVGNNTVKFNIDWTYDDGGLKENLKILKQLEPMYPKVSFNFEKMPDNYKDFVKEIIKQLKPTYDKIRRSQSWNYVYKNFLKLHPELSTIFRTPNLTEITKLYNAIYDTVIEQMKQAGIENPKFDINDPKVRDALSQKITENQQTFIIREIVYDLIKNTTMLIELDTCVDPRFTCLNTNPEDLTNSLFIETLFNGETPGKRYNLLNPNKLPKTTLGKPTDFYKIMDLNGQLLNAIF